MACDFEKISLWSNQWTAEINPSKTINVHFTRKSMSHLMVTLGYQGSEVKIIQNHSHIRILSALPA